MQKAAGVTACCLMMIAFAGFQLTQARGPFTVGLSLILIVLGLLGIAGAVVAEQFADRGGWIAFGVVAVLVVVVAPVGGLFLMSVVLGPQEGPAADGGVDTAFVEPAPRRGNAPPPPPPPGAAPAPPPTPSSSSFGSPAPDPVVPADPFVPLSTPSSPSSPPSPVANLPPSREAPQSPLSEPATTRSALVGGTGGFAFETADPTRQPVVGFRHALGSWGGKQAVAQLEPLFSRQTAGRGSTVIAREGYVVGGLQVDAAELVHAVRVVFVKQRTDGRLDKDDFYFSDWIGRTSGNSPQTLGDGQTPVIGVHGRRGAVIDALGLVLDGR